MYFGKDYDSFSAHQLFFSGPTAAVSGSVREPHRDLPKKGAHSASVVPDGAAVARGFDERLVFRPCLLPGYKSLGKSANDAVVTSGSRNASLVRSQTVPRGQDLDFR